MEGDIPLAGFQETEHTADWELEVWAPGLEALFEQAAVGMYALSGMRLDPDRRLEYDLDLSALDEEGLLVRFLSELLYLGEQEWIAFDRFALRFQPARLQAHLGGGRLLSWSPDIKAVTYHNLAIRRTGRGVETTIVFDV